MADDKNIKPGDPYEDLKGYFPEGLDLSPEELEKEIEIEKKQRSIAINMTTPKSQRKASPAARRPAAASEADKAAATVKKQAQTEKKTEWTPPAAKAVTDNELLNKYESLDGLLDEMESVQNSETDEASGKTEDEKAPKTFKDRVDWVFDFLEVFTVCMACIMLVFTFFARLTKVDGPSMNDTLQDGEYLIISDFCYTPKVGDIVVLQNTSLEIRELKNPLVKRVIAVGGQSVDVDEDGTVTITEADGTSHILEQNYIKDESYRRASYHEDVPDGFVCVMGDNRNNSTDSRSENVGLVDERCIFGHAVMRVLPLGDFKIFKNPYNN